MNWTVKFNWPTAGLKYYTHQTFSEAMGFARLFGKKVMVNLNEQTITIE